MAAIDKAALALSQCWWCVGCQRLEDDNFRGDNACEDYTRATADVIVQRRYGEEKGEERTWRPT